MKALELEAVGKLRLAEVARPEIADDELLLSTGAATICTSDLNDIRKNPFGLKLPVVLGHEGAGTVVAVGRAVRGFKPGDRVTAHPVHPCGRCPNCQRGMAHLCSSMAHFGLNMPGTFAEYFLVRADRARHIPAEVPFTLAALAEPVCVSLEALAQANLPKGGTLLILGDGPFGVIMARLARKLPLAKVVIAGHHDFRLSLASGAEQINTNKTEDPVSLLREVAGGQGYDAVILAVGRAEAVRDGLALLRPKGRLVVFSALPGQTPVDLLSVHLKELEIVGACNDDDRLDEAVAMLSDRSLRLEDLVTHSFPLSDYRQAFALAEKGHDVCLKVALTFAEEAGK
jgi:2-desacetyl-2-hydroxyethyl bacteriochlorophyllide A dehydrogenase